MLEHCRLLWRQVPLSIALSISISSTGFSMPTTTFPLTIEFQEGFEDETVLLRIAGIAGIETMRHEHVKTRLQTGYATASAVTVPGGRVVLEVELPASGERAQVVLEVRAPLWVGVNLDAGRVLCFKLSDTPFGYV
jgi:hypothetical protein